jgi:hypothetical protein
VFLTFVETPIRNQHVEHTLKHRWPQTCCSFVKAPIGPSQRSKGKPSKPSHQANTSQAEQSRAKPSSHQEQNEDFTRQVKFIMKTDSAHFKIHIAKTNPNTFRNSSIRAKQGDTAKPRQARFAWFIKGSAAPKIKTKCNEKA